MKNFIQKIKDKFSKKKTFDSSQINPHKHWIMMLLTFLVVGGLLIVFSLYILYKIKNEQIFQAAPNTGTSSSNLKENLIKQVTETFENKAKKTNEIKNNPPVFKDPSI
jgi:Na+/melibiose symporter-like transporter